MVSEPKIVTPYLRYSLLDNFTHVSLTWAGVLLTCWLEKDA